MSNNSILISITSASDIPMDNFEIVSITLCYEPIIICKINQNEDILYFKYKPKHLYQTYLLLEINNNSPLWKMEFNYISSHKSSVYNNYTHDIKLVIDFNNELSEFLNTSMVIKYLFSDIFTKMPVFNKTDFSLKSFISYDETNTILPNFKINLYDYQKKSLGKMLKIEKGENKFKIKYTVPIDFCYNEYIYDPILNKHVDEDKYLQVTSMGGVLSDEMGLGKTITTIALIVTNPYKDNHLIKFSQNLETNKLVTKATLIICPSHLIKQWETEILKCVSYLKILIIATKKDMDKVKVNNIQEADVIITSYQFLTNFKYYPGLYYKEHCTPSNFSSLDRKNCIRTKLISLLKEPVQIFDCETPLFEFFFFHRIILDEGHEILGELSLTRASMEYISSWITTMDANFYWYISGTPFINYKGVENCSRFIKLKLYEPTLKLSFNYDNKIGECVSLFSFLNKEYMWNNILEKICIRHRKIDVENQIKIPGYKENIVWVKFTDLEKQLYDAKKGKVTKIYLQQLCCHPMIIESSKKIFGDIEVDLSLMQDRLMEHHKKNYDYYKFKLEQLNPSKQEYHMLKKTYESTMNESKYMLTILEQMKNNEIASEQDCSICMSEIINPTLTKCGHLFCYECLKTWLNKKNKCPLCQGDLSGKELFVTNKKINNNNVNPLTTKYGSKLGTTISVIKTIIKQPESRIIIFSQWDCMLSLIGKTLADNGVENCFVKGNIWSRNKSINKFKKGKNDNGDDNKVIMLSLKNSASGINLTETSHIIFVEPINTSVEERQAIESQAICRACRVGQKNKIVVIRILIENSIEEEIYKNAYNNNPVSEYKNENYKIEDVIDLKNIEI